MLKRFYCAALLLLLVLVAPAAWAAFAPFMVNGSGGPAPPPAPVVAVTAPSAGTVTGSITVSASCTANCTQVLLQVTPSGGSASTIPGGTCTTTPVNSCSAPYDTTQVSNGNYTVTAVGTNAGGSTMSSGVAITVNNVAAPAVAVTAPSSGNVTGSITVSASCTMACTQVLLQVAPASGSPSTIPGGTCTTTPVNSCSTSYNTTQVSNGNYTVTAVGTNAGGTTTSSGVAIVVNNFVAVTTAILDANQLGQTGNSLDSTATVVTQSGACGAQFCSARTTTSVASGKYYWEMTDSVEAGGQILSLFMSGSVAMFGTNCSAQNCSGYAGNGGLYIGGAQVATLQTWGQGNTIAFAIDFTAQKVWAKVIGGNWDNNTTDDPGTGVGGYSMSTMTGAPFYVAAALYGSPAGAKASFNFGASAYAGTVPSGFVNWPANNLPILGNLTANVNYQSTTTAVPANPTITVSNATTLGSASVQVTSGYLSGDTLACPSCTAPIVASYSPSAAIGGMLTLTGNAPIAAYQSALQSVTFSSNAAAGIRRLTWLATLEGVAAISSIAPTSGSPAGSTVVTVNGVNFSGATEVDFCTSTPSPTCTPGTALSVTNDGQLSITSPGGTAGTTVDVRVKTAAGTSPVTAADQYTYQTVIPYTGPGDIVAFNEFYGSRAYSQAKMGQKLFNVCDSLVSHTMNFPTTGNGSNTTFSTTANTIPMVPGTVKITVSGSSQAAYDLSNTFYSNGFITWANTLNTNNPTYAYVWNGGSINYSTGAVSITWNANIPVFNTATNFPPANGAVLTLSWATYGDNACQDVFSSASTGDLVPVTFSSGLTCPNTTVNTCTIKVAYDLTQSTATTSPGNNVTQNTINLRPSLMARAVPVFQADRPCMVFPDNSNGTSDVHYLSSATNIAIGSPYSVSTVINNQAPGQRPGNTNYASGGNFYGTTGYFLSTGGAGPNPFFTATNGGGGLLQEYDIINMGGGSSFYATDHAPHIVQFMYNGSSSSANVDGTNSTASAAANSATGTVSLSSSTAQNQFQGTMCEIGLVQGDKSASNTAMYNNQFAYYMAGNVTWTKVFEWTVDFDTNCASTCPAAGTTISSSVLSNIFHFPSIASASSQQNNDLIVAKGNGGNALEMNQPAGSIDYVCCVVDLTLNNSGAGAFNYYVVEWDQKYEDSTISPNGLNYDFNTGGGGVTCNGVGKPGMAFNFTNGSVNNGGGGNQEIFFDDNCTSFGSQPYIARNFPYTSFNGVVLAQQTNHPPGGGTSSSPYTGAIVPGVWYHKKIEIVLGPQGWFRYYMNNGPGSPLVLYNSFSRGGLSGTDSFSDPHAVTDYPTPSLSMIPHFGGGASGPPPNGNGPAHNSYMLWDNIHVTGYNR
jgi:hypothetical protein